MASAVRSLEGILVDGLDNLRVSSQREEPTGHRRGPFGREPILHRRRGQGAVSSSPPGRQCQASGVRRCGGWHPRERLDASLGSAIATTGRHLVFAIVAIVCVLAVPVG